MTFRKEYERQLRRLGKGRWTWEGRRYEPPERDKAYAKRIAKRRAKKRKKR